MIEKIENGKYINLYKIDDNHWELKKLSDYFEKIQLIIERQDRTKKLYSEKK